MIPTLNWTANNQKIFNKANTLQDIFVADQFATTEISAVRKYGKIEQKPSHFGRHRK